jgi:hypothetical protein
MKRFTNREAGDRTGCLKQQDEVRRIEPVHKKSRPWSLAMSFWTFALLMVVFGWIGVIHLINSDSKAGELCRAFVRGLIEKLVGRKPDSRQNRPKDN